MSVQAVFVPWLNEKTSFFQQLEEFISYNLITLVYEFVCDNVFCFPFLSHFQYINEKVETVSAQNKTISTYYDKTTPRFRKHASQLDANRLRQRNLTVQPPKLKHATWYLVARKGCDDVSFRAIQAPPAALLNKRPATNMGLYTNTSSELFKYNVLTKSWTQIAKSPNELLMWTPMATSTRGIYMLVAEKDVFFLDTTTTRVSNVGCDVDGDWKKLKSLPYARARSSFVVFNNTLYVIGGYDHEYLEVSPTVMRLEQNAKIWRRCASMNKHRACPVVFIINGLICVYGGDHYWNAFSRDYRPNSSKPTLEYYDPRTDKWTLSEQTSTAKMITSKDCAVLAPNTACIFQFRTSMN